MGLPDDVGVGQSGTLGMQLVATLVEQLEGTLAVERENGTRVRISFPLDRGDS